MKKFLSAEHLSHSEIRVNLFFSNKYAKGNSNIMLDEGESALMKNDYAAEEFSKSIEKIFSHLDLHEFHS